MGGSGLIVRVLEGIELFVRRSADSLGGFGNGLRYDSDPLRVSVDCEAFGCCSDDELSLLSRPNGDCCGK